MLAACGGGDDDGGAQEEAISRADAICREANEQVRAIQARTTSGPDAQAEGVREIERIGERALADLRAVEAPDEGRATWDEFLSRSEQQVDRLDDLEAAVETGDRARVQEALQEVQRVDALANAAAREYGLHDCGR